MKLVELLDRANRGYPDGYLAEYYDKKTGKLKRGSGDTLAEFIVKELADTFDDDADDKTQIDTAVHMLERAMDDLVLTAAALDGSLQAPRDDRR